MSSDHNKPVIVVNGSILPESAVMTINIAIELFSMDLRTGELGGDIGKTLSNLYLENIKIIRKYMVNKIDKDYLWGCLGHCDICKKDNVPIEFTIDPFIDEIYPERDNEKKNWCKECFDGRKRIYNIMVNNK